MASTAAALLVSLALCGAALAADSPPKNTALPTISPTAPHLGQELTASKGTWTSEGPAHWLEGGAALAEGKKVTVKSSGGPISLTTTIGGVKITMSCTTALSAASLENPSGGAAGLGSGELQLSSCKAEGKWGTCAVSNGGAVPVNLALATPGGIAEVAITPREGTLLASFSFSSCSTGALNGNYTLNGVLRGTYSNASSRIEFGASTTAGEELFINNSGNPVSKASGSIGLETTSGGAIGADAATYAYQWNRCSGGVCSAISGATQATYTPVSADVNHKLTVSVTATNPYGSTTATSAETGTVQERLSWYQYTGQWIRPSSLAVTTKSEVSKVKFTQSEVAWTITCTGGKGQATLVNDPGRAELSGWEPTLTSCTIVGGGSAGCKFPGGQLPFKSLTGRTPEAPETLNRELKIEPTTGTVVASFSVEGCEFTWFNGTYTVTGWYAAPVTNPGSYMTTTSNGTKAHLTLTHGTEVVPFGIEGSTVIHDNSEHALKLDTVG